MVFYIHVFCYNQGFFMSRGLRKSTLPHNTSLYGTLQTPSVRLVTLVTGSLSEGVP